MAERRPRGPGGKRQTPPLCDLFLAGLLLCFVLGRVEGRRDG